MESNNISNVRAADEGTETPRWLSSAGTALLLLSLLALILEKTGWLPQSLRDNSEYIIWIGTILFAISYFLLTGLWIFGSPRNERFERFTLVILMLPGVIMVCQPYYHFLFRWGFLVTIIGIVAFTIAGHTKKE